MMRLYHETAGTGEPVVLIAGLGADAHFWHHQMPALARRFRVIAPDNRDTSRSAGASARYGIGDMADDVAGLLDEIEVDRAHIVGASLGGFIAQEFALAHPDRTRSLVLCCTSFGGPRAVPIPAETVAVLASRTGDPERDLRAFLPVQLATDYLRTHGAEIDAYVAWRVAHPQSLEAYHRQLAAASAHDSEDRLGRLRMPVLILHGSHDRVVPTENARLMAARIPQARLRIIPDAGHLVLWEHADDCNHIIMEFLSGSDPTEEERR